MGLDVVVRACEEEAEGGGVEDAINLMCLLGAAARAEGRGVEDPVIVAGCLCTALQGKSEVGWIFCGDVIAQ